MALKEKNGLLFIASGQMARDIQSGQAEMKQNYILLERPEIAESKSID